MSMSKISRSQEQGPGEQAHLAVEGKPEKSEKWPDKLVTMRKLPREAKEVKSENGQ